MIWRVKEMAPTDAKERTRIGEAFARQLLEEYSGQAAASFVIKRTPKGKPYAEGSPLEFSLSHSGKWLLCAVGDQPLGVDIEVLRPRNLKVAERFFTPKEQAFLAPEQEDAYLRFLQIWTAKEAYFKAIGTGITDLKSICYFDLLPHLQQIVTEDYILSIYQ